MKRIIVLIMVLLLSCLTLFIGCSGDSDDDGNKDQGGLTVKQMVDFESINEIKSVALKANETQIFLNTDKNYVSTGEKSMKMILNQSINTTVGFYEDAIMQFIPSQIYFNQVDFSNVVGISADIWNDNSFNVKICFSLNNRALVLGYKELTPGYNNVVFTWDNNQIISFTDKQLISLDFSFYSGKGNETIYIDNVCLVSTSELFVPYSWDNSYSKNIAFGYEDELESNLMIDLGGYDSIFSRTKTSINNDSRYITQGNGSLKVDFISSPKDGQVDNKSIRTYDKILPNLNNYADNDYITFDIYNATARTIKIKMRILSTIISEDEYNGEFFDIPAKQWLKNGQVKVTIGEIKEAFYTANGTIINEKTIVFEFDNVLGGDTIYIDNVRIVKN